MNQVDKKKTMTPKPRKPRAAAFQMSHSQHTTKPTGKAKNGAALQTIDAKELAELAVNKKLRAEVGEFYPYPALWLEAPHALLGGRTPLEVAQVSQEGYEFIFDMIQSIKAGNFS